MDLEQEFEKIVHNVYEDIRARVRTGVLTAAEGDKLIEMVELRLDPSVAGEYDRSYDMDTWQSSQQCW